MKFQEIVEKRDRNMTSENGLTPFEKDELIEAMYEKLRAIDYILKADSVGEEADCIATVMESE